MSVIIALVVGFAVGSFFPQPTFIKNIVSAVASKLHLK